jgi:hypothetical protein
MQVQHMCETPIILFGQMWAGLIAWLQTEVLAKQFFTSHDLHNIFQLNSVPEVIDFINRVYSDRFSGASRQFLHEELQQTGTQVVHFNNRQIRARWDEELNTVIVEELDGTPLPSLTAFAFVYPAFFGQ